ncbi:MAG: hypothetical protein WBF39_14630 [Planococcus donghaensis]
MEQVLYLPHERVNYFFLKSKDVHVEEGNIYITCFARLTREVLIDKDKEEQKRIQTFWVDINELRFEQASKKIRDLPNCMQRYEITKEVFYNLYQLSKKCPEEVFQVIPYHKNSTCEKFII